MLKVLTLQASQKKSGLVNKKSRVVKKRLPLQVGHFRCFIDIAPRWFLHWLLVFFFPPFQNG